jgi:transposase
LSAPRNAIERREFLDLSIHTTPEIRAWLATQRGRVRLEFLPLHASWLNQIEIWFSILERQALTRASDTAYPLRAARRIFKAYPLSP